MNKNKIRKAICPSIPLMVAVLSLGLFTACANNETSPTAADGTNADTFSAAKGCKNVAVLLPESDSSARYEAYDRPLLEQEIKKELPGVTIQYANANNNADTQQNQAEAALTREPASSFSTPKTATRQR